MGVIQKPAQKEKGEIKMEQTAEQYYEARLDANHKLKVYLLSLPKSTLLKVGKHYNAGVRTSDNRENLAHKITNSLIPMLGMAFLIVDHENESKSESFVKNYSHREDYAQEIAELIKG